MSVQSRAKLRGAGGGGGGAPAETLNNMRSSELPGLPRIRRISENFGEKNWCCRGGAAAGGANSVVRSGRKKKGTGFRTGENKMQEGGDKTDQGKLRQKRNGKRGGWHDWLDKGGSVKKKTRRTRAQATGWVNPEGSSKLGKVKSVNPTKPTPVGKRHLHCPSNKRCSQHSGWRRGSKWVGGCNRSLNPVSPH